MYRFKQKLADTTKSKRVLDFLSFNEDWITRALVAGNINTELSSLRRLSYDWVRMVRVKVTYNSNIDSITKYRLLGESHDKWDFA